MRQIGTGTAATPPGTLARKAAPYSKRDAKTPIKKDFECQAKIR
jgi:hypothetical protein